MSHRSPKDPNRWRKLLEKVQSDDIITVTSSDSDEDVWKSIKAIQKNSPSKRGKGKRYRSRRISYTRKRYPRRLTLVTSSMESKQEEVALPEPPAPPPPPVLNQPLVLPPPPDPIPQAPEPLSVVKGEQFTVSLCPYKPPEIKDEPGVVEQQETAVPPPPTSEVQTESDQVQHPELDASREYIRMVPEAIREDPPKIVHHSNSVPPDMGSSNPIIPFESLITPRFTFITHCEVDEVTGKWTAANLMPKMSDWMRRNNMDRCQCHFYIARKLRPDLPMDSFCVLLLPPRSRRQVRWQEMNPNSSPSYPFIPHPTEERKADHNNMLEQRRNGVERIHEQSVPNPVAMAILEGQVHHDDPLPTPNAEALFAEQQQALPAYAHIEHTDQVPDGGAILYEDPPEPTEPTEATEEEEDQFVPSPPHTPTPYD